ncbi:hypothetical protein [Burkholderia sp. SIMBA_062]
MSVDDGRIARSPEKLPEITTAGGLDQIYTSCWPSGKPENPADCRFWF